MRTGLLAVTTVALAALVLAGCGAARDPAAGNGLPTGAPVTDDGRLHVVAAENLWGDIARQIGAGQIRVDSILSNPNQDPHEYQSTVGDASTLSTADVVIVNGADYDPFMDSLLSTGGHHRTVVTIAKVVGVRSGANPHLWYDPAYVVRAARAIERTLAQRAPAHARAFAAGLASFLRGEARVEGVLATIRARHAGAKVGYTEPVPGYLVQAAGLQLGTPKAFSLALENGSDPSPGDAAHFEDAIRHRAIEVLLLNTQVSDAETDRLAGIAKQSGVPVVSVTETLPPGRDFQTWQAGQASALLAALDG